MVEYAHYLTGSTPIIFLNVQSLSAMSLAIRLKSPGIWLSEDVNDLLSYFKGFECPNLKLNNTELTRRASTKAKLTALRS
jgi:hypothetical protein